MSYSLITKLFGFFLTTILSVFLSGSSCPGGGVPVVPASNVTPCTPGNQVFLVASGSVSGPWSDSTSDLQAAVNAMDKPSEIWVAQGSYPFPLQFLTNQKVEMYGGFKGSEAACGARVNDE